VVYTKWRTQELMHAVQSALVGFAAQAVRQRAQSLGEQAGLAAPSTMCLEDLRSQRHQGGRHLSELVQVDFQRLHILLKAQRAHGPEQVIAVDGFPLLPLALVARPAHARGASTCPFDLQAGGALRSAWAA